MISCAYVNEMMSSVTTHYYMSVVTMMIKPSTSRLPSYFTLAITNSLITTTVIIVVIAVKSTFAQIRTVIGNLYLLSPKWIM